MAGRPRRAVPFWGGAGRPRGTYHVKVSRNDGTARTGSFSVAAAVRTGANGAAAAVPATGTHCRIENDLGQRVDAVTTDTEEGSDSVSWSTTRRSTSR